MDVIHTLFSTRQRLSPNARRGWAISRRLFRDTTPTASDVAALISLGGEAIEPFRMVLQRNGNRHGSARREEIIEIIASHLPAANDTDANTIIALLASFLEDREGMVGARAVTFLAGFGPRVNNLLLKALAQGNRWCRSHAAKALGEQGSVRAVPGLIRALADSDERVRSDAAEALGKLGDPKATPSLFNALADPNWLVRESASSALIQFNDRDILSRLHDFLQDDDPNIRCQAIHTLRGIDAPEALPLLIAALEDPDFEVAWEAIGALAERGDASALPPLLIRFRRGEPSMQEQILATCRAIGLQAVVTLLEHHEQAIRVTAAEVISRAKAVCHLPALCRAWHGEAVQEARMQMTLAIGRLVAHAGAQAPDDAVRLLMKAARSSDRGTRYHAEKTLEELDHPLAEQFLQAPATARVAIACPNCLHTLHLQPPLTGKRWHCGHCTLHFTIRPAADGSFTVVPDVRAPAHRPPSGREQPWFEVLQLPSDAPPEAIQESFRRLIKQYHPDRVSGLGPEFQQLAEEKSRLLTWALRTGLRKNGA